MTAFAFRAEQGIPIAFRAVSRQLVLKIAYKGMRGKYKCLPNTHAENLPSEPKVMVPIGVPRCARDVSQSVSPRIPSSPAPPSPAGGRGTRGCDNRRFPTNANAGGPAA